MSKTGRDKNASIEDALQSKPAVDVIRGTLNQVYDQGYKNGLSMGKRIALVDLKHGRTESEILREDEGEAT